MRLPRHFLDHWLRAFEKSRIDNHLMVTGFVTRLESILPAASRPAAGPSSDYQMGRGWRSSPDARLSFWQTLGLAWQERRYLRRALPRRGEAAMWLVADDRRSGVIEDWAALANQLRIFGGQTAPPWIARWQAEGRQLICFTPNLLALRPADPGGAVYLSYLSLFAVPLAWPGAFVVAAAQMLANQPLGALSRRNAWITSLLAASFEVLLARQVPDRMLMITSNSFVIELLRYTYAVSGQGEGVTEVLHGVPTLEIEAYHQTMVGSASLLLSDRLTFVPPVPSLRVNAANGHIRVTETAINLKMNAVGWQRDLWSLADVCVRRESVRGAVRVVALNGAGTVEGKHYLQTGCFAAELAILRYVLAECCRNGIQVHVQYSLHPAHIKSGDAEAIRDVLSTDEVEVLDDSLQTWLESDLCISIFSGASWDALALGCDVVFGVSPDDQLYSGEMLASFLHPTRDCTLFEILSQAIARLPERPRPSPHERVAMICGKSASVS